MKVSAPSTERTSRSNSIGLLREKDMRANCLRNEDMDGTPLSGHAKRSGSRMDFLIMELKAAVAGGALALVVWGAVAVTTRLLSKEEGSDTP